MTLTITRRIEGIPEAEKAHLEQLFDYYLMLLSVMPASQRFEEYAKAQIAMAHHSRFALEADNPAIDASVAEHASR